ncbi:MAG: hypothetical protein V2I36_10305 [Desulfopila sp.]|jgi:hypothetical protein|nr:hypothetical protein [Desulfopila sp.]
MTKISILPVTTLVFLLLIFSVTSAESLTNKYRRGSTFTSKAVEITNISSQRLEDRESGYVRYAFKAKVRNRINKPINVSVTFHAVDRNGYEIEEVYFSRMYIKKNGTGVFTDRDVVHVEDYEKIWEWKVKNLRFH